MRRFSNPVFVSGHTRSGTNLLMRLIDGAPDLLVPPGEGKLNVLRRLFGLSYPIVGESREIAELIWDNIELNLDATREARFRALLLEQLATDTDPRGFIDTVGDLLTTVSRFVAEESGANERPRWLEKNHNLEFYWNRAVRLFGRPKLLFVLRNPFDNWLSWRQYMTQNGLESNVEVFGGVMRRHYENEIEEAACGRSAFEGPRAIAEHYGLRFDENASANTRNAGLSFDETLLPGVQTAAGRFAWNYRRMYERVLALREESNDVMVVRYEDMVLNTADTMRGVMEFLECEWSDVNLTPTDHATTWAGNSSFASVPGVVDAKSVGRGRASLASEDIDSLKRVLAGVPGVELQTQGA